MKSVITLLLAALILTGCKNSAERSALTQQSAANPEKVCTMPDGRTLFCITVNRVNYDHYVYFFSSNDTKTVTVNFNVPQGKSSRVETIVLDGETYLLVPKK
jgi:uncharacterized lipoprotein NlpE involved in copper resistance